MPTFIMFILLLACTAIIYGGMLLDRYLRDCSGKLGGHDIRVTLNKIHEFGPDNSHNEEVAVCTRCGKMVEHPQGGYERTQWKIQKPVI